MLTNDFRTVVNNQFKEIFYGERKKKLIFWQFFLFLINVMSKLSYNRLLAITLRAPVSITLFIEGPVNGCF